MRPGQILDPQLGGWFATRFVLLGWLGLTAGWSLMVRPTPAQGALWIFMAVAIAWLRVVHRGALDGLRIGRSHSERVFEGDAVSVSLRVSLDSKTPVQMLQLVDHFDAALQLHRQHLIPLLPGGWEVIVHERVRADRHRGLYVIGPVHVRAADPLGVWVATDTVAALSRLTIYPQAYPIEGYRVPGPALMAGPSMDRLERVGLGEQVIGVREYRPGDPPNRIHWRTSARRGHLHVIERNRPIQTELAVMLDLTCTSKLGLGAESTTELAIGAAVSLLTCAYHARHRFSLSWAQESWLHFKAESGLAYLHMLLDRLAVVQASGVADFWKNAQAQCLAMPAGSRVVFVVIARRTPWEAVELIQNLVNMNLAVDVVLIDQQEFMAIYEEQTLAGGGQIWANARELEIMLRNAGAQVWPLSRTRRQVQPVQSV